MPTPEIIGDLVPVVRQQSGRGEGGGGRWGGLGPQGEEFVRALQGLDAFPGPPPEGRKSLMEGPRRKVFPRRGDTTRTHRSEESRTSKTSRSITSTLPETVKKPLPETRITVRRDVTAGKSANEEVEDVQVSIEEERRSIGMRRSVSGDSEDTMSEFSTVVTERSEMRVKSRVTAETQARLAAQSRASEEYYQKRKERRQKRHVENRVVIPWALLDELDGEKKKFEREKSYFEFNTNY